MKYILALLATCLIVAAADPLPTNWRFPWKKGDTVGVKGGIPTVTNIYITLSSTATASQIQTHLEACPSNQVVYLLDGQYNIGATIDCDEADGAVLRGQSTNVHFYWASASSPGTMISIRSPYRYDDPPVDYNRIRQWDSGYEVGSSNIVIRSPATAAETGNTNTSLKVGRVICLMQQNDAPLVNAYGYDGSFLTNASQIRTNGGWAQMQWTRITSITDGTNLGIWPPVAMTNIQSSLTPEIVWAGNAQHFVGIENIRFSYSNNVGPATCIMLQSTHDSWVKNCSFEYVNKGVLSWHSLNLEVRDSRFFENKSHGANSYGTEYQLASGLLHENNVHEYQSSGVLIGQGFCCSVVGYNFMTNSIYVTTNSTWMAQDINTHYVHNNNVLFEGNVLNGINFDFIHGSASHHVVHRNKMYGKFRAVQDSNLQIVFAMATNQNMAFIGNMLGYGNTWYTNYEHDVAATEPTSAAKVRTIWRTGHYGNNQVQNEGDSSVKTTMVRAVNYDVVTSTNSGVVWGGYQESDLVDSYYLTSQPDWWDDYVDPNTEAAPPWPAIGPDLSPMISPIPAELRYYGAEGGGGDPPVTIIKNKSLRGKYRLRGRYSL